MSELEYPKRFNVWINAIIDLIEKGYVNHPDDTGGATNFGITQRVARSYGYKGDMRNFPRSMAVEIYYKEYWQGKIQEHLANRIGLLVFDTSINSGYGQAIKLLQRACGVKADGIVGVDTLGAISLMKESELCNRFNEERLKFYKSLKNFNVFGKGWINRMRILDDEKFYIDRQDYLS